MAPAENQLAPINTGVNSRGAMCFLSVGAFSTGDLFLADMEPSDPHTCGGKSGPQQGHAFLPGHGDGLVCCYGNGKGRIRRRAARALKGKVNTWVEKVDQPATSSCPSSGAFSAPSHSSGS